MNQDQAIDIGNFLRSKREDVGLSQAEVARRAGVDKGTVSRVESAQFTARTDNLQAIGEVVGVSLTDIFAAGGRIPSTDLPSIRPYLRAKYCNMPTELLEEIEGYLEQLARERGISFDGPLNDEDQYTTTAN
ncbi:helix-turn-helix domain-containing protein [Nocardia bovistercoris]|uniref:Helix-turn-helix transcriptional regulator n=1 Tax=Nocardia bovistercoris TaxID=2785916 RepID=A0A931N5J9_9NOCA|nr:helix-turn-helix transcriptional regulator [Nocardia bovistercoris]MBH0779929.1 helix-turn-helix transcriptional regulator [Nocardia bovistercoris]